MRRIDTPNAVAAKPAPTAGGTPGFFFDGNPVTGQPGTEVSADWLNQLQELVRTPILSAGYTDPTRDQVDLLQLAIRWHAAAVLQPYSQAILHIIAAGGLTFDPTQTDQLKRALLLISRPVGTVEIRYDAIDPATIYGGTWTQFGAGRVLVGLDAADPDFDTIGKTGGEKTHVLTTGEMPAHTHSLDNRILTEGITGAGFGGTTPDNSAPVSATGSTGGGQAHNNLQPYLVVRFWRRTA